MSDIHAVLLTVAGQTKRYTAEFQSHSEYEKSWQRVLRDAYGHAEVRCACRGAGAKRLAIKYYEFAGSYSLAKFSLSGQEHARDCQYHGQAGTGAGGGNVGAGVLDVQPDGSVKIRLEIGMTVRESGRPAVTQEPNPNRPRAPSMKQSAIKLAGLLHFLWDSATLNQWRPYWEGKRNFRQVFWRINQAADDVHAGDVKLADQLLLPAMAADSPEAARNLARVDTALQSKKRMLIIAPLAGYSPAREEQMVKGLSIAGFHGIPRAFLREGQWDLLTKRYRTCTAAWKAGQTTIVIAQVEIREWEGRRSASVVDAALMSVSAQWIPTDSSYERLVAERLVAEARSFYKPLIYKHEEDQVFPDFVLTDCDRGEVPMEVFGRSDDEYLERKEKKTGYYNRTYGAEGWWSWDATRSDSPTGMPPFPAARGAKRVG